MQEVFKNIQSFDTPNNGFYTHSAIRVSDGETVYFAKKMRINIPEETIVEYSDIKTTSKGSPSYRGVKILNSSGSSAPTSTSYSNQAQNYISPTNTVADTPVVTVSNDGELLLKIVSTIAPLCKVEEDFDTAVSKVFNKAVSLLPKVKQIAELGEQNIDNDGDDSQQH